MKRAIRGSARVLKGLSPLRLRKRRNKKRSITKFCEEVGLVYFGFVSQRDDDHHIVRGLTVSNKHQDHHYCIGSHGGYDVVFVERSDTILTNHHHVWHIMEFDLKYARELPHIFVGSPTHGLGFHSLLKAKYPQLHSAHLGVFGRHSTEFIDYFKIFAKPDQWLAAERIFTPDITAQIGKHFRGLVLEIINDSLYIYSEKAFITHELLTTMLANGLWLARAIDEKSRPEGQPEESAEHAN